MIEIEMFIIGLLVLMTVGPLIGLVILPQALWKRQNRQLSTKQQQSTGRPITATGATKPPRAPLPTKGMVYGTGPAPTIPPPPPRQSDIQIAERERAVGIIRDHVTEYRIMPSDLSSYSVESMDIHNAALEDFAYRVSNTIRSNYVERVY